METNFSAEQLLDPATREAEKILHTCVHCGFCTATCPTYLLLGDELDSPRGRIYLIKDMLENEAPATAEVVKHVDRCLSCLSCMTTCPSGVHYAHLVDHARAHIETTYRRPFRERALRSALAAVLPHRRRLRLALRAATIVRPFRSVLDLLPGTTELRAMLDLAPARLAAASPQSVPKPLTQSDTVPRRVALLTGCAQPVLRPSINEATIRLLRRHGVEVVLPKGEGCCGALVHHIGKEKASLDFARRNVDAWVAEMDGPGLDAILITASGCGTTIKDYGYMLREDPAYAERARRVSAIANDITEFLSDLTLVNARTTGQTIAYHSACSLQHGQQVKDAPKRLLKRAGFDVRGVPEAHICCGSAGTYNMLQPELSRQLLARKVANIERVKPEFIATGNIGCISQVAHGTSIPIVHTVELLDWATGGPLPLGLDSQVVQPT
jgi:glycolate oxidase iron-sulfur subunit